jgi:hypothetical protein
LTATKRFAPVLLIVLMLLVGCGARTQSARDKAAVENEFMQIDFEMANLMVGADTHNEPRLERLTRRYVEMTRKYADELGEAGVKKRLADKASEMGTSCLPCVAILDAERARR